MYDIIKIRGDDKMKILVTGGLGFIGSHTCVELLNGNYEVVIIDNLSNSSIDVLDKIEQITSKRPKFYEIDACDKEKVKAVFKENRCRYPFCRI